MKTLKISKEIELLLGSFGAVQSAFLTIYLFFSKKHNTTNTLLSVFFFFISIRVIKSLLWVYLDMLPDWFINIGFIAHYATGPTLFLYFLCVVKQKKWHIADYLHFVPSLVLLPFIFRINGGNFWHLGGYSFLLYHQLIYTVLTFGILFLFLIKTGKHTPIIKKEKKYWLFILFLGTASIQFAYFSNYILGLSPYLLGPIIYTVFIYIIAFYAFLNQSIFEEKETNSKYQNINITNQEFRHYQNEIIQIMTSEKPFLNPSFTLDKLSKQISLPTYLTSHIINKGFNTNFSDFINSYRINEAVSKLTSSSYSHIKISQIAYDCGFNTLSSFNNSFKKIKETTPSQYRKMNT
ncbi:helix-turn-helix domain-containing protein [Aquimarina sediminis]|uniref:helix-turn-helix domain-containing protein n=1 Tax=Aquimarina sediminis TaxID=2070536 RepID=UPI000CA049AF|nr:AraC family transcriptional regulator [Aquimarina sediminis]